MNTEKDMLKQNLERQQKPEEIQQFIEDTELMGGHEDIVELAKAKLAGLEKTVEEITPPVEITEAQETQVENNDGSTEKLHEITEPIEEQISKKDEEIKNVQAETGEKIEEVTNDNEVAEPLESFMVPFGEHQHTIEITSQEEYFKAAEKLKKLGYVWNGNKDLMKGIDNEFVKFPLKLIAEENDATKKGGTDGKIVTYLQKGTGKDY